MSDKLQQNIDATIKRLAEQDPDYAFMMGIYLNESHTKQVFSLLNIFEDAECVTNTESSNEKPTTD